MTRLYFGASELVQLKKLCSTHNSGGIGRRKFDDGGRSSGSSSSEPNLGKRLIQFYILDSRIIEMSYIPRPRVLPPFLKARMRGLNVTLKRVKRKKLIVCFNKEVKKKLKKIKKHNHDVS